MPNLGPTQYILLTWLDDGSFPEIEKAEVFGPFDHKHEAEEYREEHFDLDIITRIATLYPITD